MRLLLLCCVLAACDDGGAASPDAAPLPIDASSEPDAPAEASVDAALDAAPDAEAPDARADVGPPPESVQVLVLLDGQPTEGVLVVQGGSLEPGVRSDAEGLAELPIDLSIVGAIGVIASHPEARIRAQEFYGGPPRERVTIELARFGPDNPDYRLADHGTPRRRNSTAECAHCHRTFNEQWWASPHRRAASNPVVRDLYAGTASFDEATCAELGGRWLVSRAGPGAASCYLGEGVLPTLNPGCEEGPCPQPEVTAGCADCHAPGINGGYGGRDLLEATDLALEGGVSCDVCHRVERVDLEAEAGVAGRLVMHRPSDPGPVSLGAGGVLPLTFGPSHDSPNPRMGSVQRDHYRDATLCAGCHELHQPVYVPEGLDRARWPSGRLPVHTTWSEWKASALSEATRCNDCHMPPRPEMINGADKQLFPEAPEGITGGWFRPPGSSRAHSWVGPRAPESQMLQLAAAIFVTSTAEPGALTTRVTVRNVSAGHAIPTGEPLRAMLLVVQATCAGEPLVPTGGDVLPSWAGALGVKQRGEDWGDWPEARIGDRVRVIARPGGFHDYPAFGRLGELPPEQRGLPIEAYVGEREVLGVEGGLRFDAPLPEGDFALLVRGPKQLAGAPGHAFARVLRDASGRAMVPHFMATDVSSDNRLMPQAAWTSTHTFASTCAAPEVQARLIYRPAPLALREARGWSRPDELMVEVRK